MRTSRLARARVTLILALVLLLTPLAQAAQPLVAASYAKHRYGTQDHLGSTSMLTDSTGAVVAEYDYDDFGATSQVAGDPSLYNPYRWTGQQFDPEAGDGGLYFLRARSYSPKIGRFLSRDPIGYGGGTNLFAYCGGDPVNYADPSGLIPAPIAWWILRLTVQYAPEVASMTMTAASSPVIYGLIEGLLSPPGYIGAGGFFQGAESAAGKYVSPHIEELFKKIGASVDEVDLFRAVETGCEELEDIVKTGQYAMPPPGYTEEIYKNFFATGAQAARYADDVGRAGVPMTVTVGRFSYSSLSDAVFTMYPPQQIIKILVHEGHFPGGNVMIVP